MQFTPQQMAGYKGYSHGVLVGNWSEDVQVMEDKLHAFQDRQHNGGMPVHLPLQKVPLTPEPKDGILRFGSVLEFASVAFADATLALDTEPRLRPKTNHVVLSVAVPQKIPIARSAWTLRRVKDEASALHAARPDVVHFGQTVRLVNEYCSKDGFLTVHSERFDTQTQSRGGKQLATACLGDSKACNFTIERANHDVQDPRAYEGQPVPSDAIVVLRHCMTNAPLYVDAKAKVSGVGGVEPEVACHLDKPGGIRHALPKEQNFWALKMGPKGGAFTKKETAVSGTALERVRAKILERGGADGFRGLVRVFKIIDDDGDRKLDRRELREGMAVYGVHLVTAELDVIFSTFDANGDGVVSITEFLRAIRGSMSRPRQDLVREAFKRLDRDGSGVAEFAEFKAAYGRGLPRHPEVLSGQKTEQQVLREFVAQWGDRNADGAVTLREFLEYYNDISVSIDDDEYFELMLRNAWHMSGGEGAAENTSCKRVLVVYNDDRQEVVELTDDLGVDVTDTTAVRAKLRQQGICNVKRVELHH